MPFILSGGITGLYHRQCLEKTCLIKICRNRNPVIDHYILLFSAKNVRKIHGFGNFLSTPPREPWGGV
jgi:hypothetical protein